MRDYALWRKEVMLTAAALFQADGCLTVLIMGSRSYKSVHCLAFYSQLPMHLPSATFVVAQENSTHS